MIFFKLALTILYFCTGLSFSMALYRHDVACANDGTSVTSAVLGVALWPMAAAMRVGEMIVDPADVRPLGCMRRTKL